MTEPAYWKARALAAEARVKDLERISEIDAKALGFAQNGRAAAEAALSAIRDKLRPAVKGVKGATGGEWEAIDREIGGHHFQFVRAPDVVVENSRGPGYAQQILSDEDYPTKGGDIVSITAAMNALRSREVVAIVGGE